MSKSITLSELKKCLEYNSETGVWKWKETLSARALTGEIAGTIGVHGYRIITLHGKKYRSSRLAWFYVKGIWPSFYIDHKNRNRSDDRFDNLREATHTENQKNMTKQKHKTLPKGVFIDKRRNKIYSKIICDGNFHWLGYHKSIADAETAYRLASKKLFGEFGS